jgi:hypothetical protein
MWPYSEKMVMEPAQSDESSAASRETVRTRSVWRRRGDGVRVRERREEAGVLLLLRAVEEVGEEAEWRSGAVSGSCAWLSPGVAGRLGRGDISAVCGGGDGMVWYGWMVVGRRVDVGQIGIVGWMEMGVGAVGLRGRCKRCFWSGQAISSSRKRM